MQRVAAGLVLVAGLSLAGSAWWLARQTAPPAYFDELRYLRMAERLHAELRRPGLDLARRLLDVHPTHPPLVPLVSAALFPVLGRDPHAHILAWQALSLALLFASLAVLARRIGRPALALPAAFLFVTTPAAVVWSRCYLTDLPLAALTTASLTALLCSDRFARPGPSLLAGLCAGLALLARWTAASTLLFPFLVAALRPRRAGPFLLALGGGALVAGPWYVGHGGRLWDFFLWNQEAAPVYFEIGDGTWSAASLLYDVRQLPASLGWAALLASAWGLARGRRAAPGFAAATLVTLAVCAVIRMKAELGRYLLPVLPLLSFLAAAAPAPPRAAAALVLLACAWTGAVTVGLPLPSARGLGTRIDPVDDDRGAAGIAAAALPVLAPDGRLFLASQLGRGDWGVCWHALRRGQPIRMISPGQHEEIFLEMRSTTGFQELLDAETLVVKEPLPLRKLHDRDHHYREAWARFLGDPPPAFARNHGERARVPLYEHTHAVVLARVAGPDPEERREVAAASLRMLPADPTVYRALADLPGFAAAAEGLEAARRDDHALAAARLDEAVARAPREPLLHRARAEAALRAGDVRAAIAAARESRDGALLGRALLAAGDPEGAAAAFEAATADPWDDAPWRGLGDAWERLGRTADAARARARAEQVRRIREEPMASVAELVAFVHELMERGAHATAVPFLRRAVLLAPHDPAPLAWLILALARTAGPEAARRELEDLVGWNGLAREQSERLRALCEPR